MDEIKNATVTFTALAVGSTTSNSLRDEATMTAPVLVDSGAVYTPGISERRGTKTTYLHSGLQLLGHRYYDPSTGRFLTRDPIFDGRSWYSYGGGEGDLRTSADPTSFASTAILVGGAIITVAGLIAGGIKAEEMIDGFRADKVDPDQNVYGDYDQLKERQEAVPVMLKEMNKCVVGEYKDAYFVGPVKETHPDVKIGVDLTKAVGDFAKWVRDKAADWWRDRGVFR